ncbi:selenium metabolism protein YedF [Aedoeadaptatus ivorii]|uniref:Selenium metabolism protein YedF n=1 Tax=Aedoeadaptatus ivorii TaxID=54006 RepID=A0A448V067_9FIRM|nr:sulfurtransferase-like selenium metabolism protein YedF [Peptoniphilus ivorii]VEJ34859.1 selenium metabolism protein YedF [Peptoniphilus ivorii]
MKEIDAMGQACPRPVIMTKKAISEENLEEVLVKVDNKIATENLSKMAKQLGFTADVTEHSPAAYDVYLQKTGDVCDVMDFEDEGKDYAVVISSTEMGTGEEAFSKTLLEGFIYALTEQDIAPKYVIFYNTGVLLPTGNEKVIADLKALEEKGAEVLSCGLCLEQYGVKDKVQVGSITNMYRICELMIQNKVVKPC